MVVMEHGRPLNKCPRCGETYEITPSIADQRTFYTVEGEEVIVTTATCKMCHQIECVQFDDKKSKALLGRVMQMMQAAMIRDGSTDPFLEKKYKRANEKLNSLRKQNEQKYKGTALYDKFGGLLLENLEV